MKTFLIDLDGTMYHGSIMVEGAQAFLDRIKESGNRYIFLTNNATRTLKQNKEHMEAIGFNGIQEEDFFTSSMAAAMHVAENYKERNAYMVGKDGLREALLTNGFHITDKDVDFVFVGLDKDGTYEMYSHALSFLLNGAKLIGTNSDRRLATSEGYAIGNGSVVALFEYASEQKSEKIGKPYAPILNQALRYFDIQKEDVVMVGDNLETDIALGQNTGIDTILITSGVHSRIDVETFGIKPTYIVDSLDEIQVI
ncbi:4-nitrophenyl phosphatase [Breznakia blatticola]|uniref:4-nitrophenyl phosphatase n=1 Tax=Breznakia blatticola TaxID=1754012 RepID=A0A4R7ZCG5_9FIRM|nr:HAD-IIA family hydrolase [Breznakia blatticola]TDW13154.1 4-nitrophenyl phosphatase [Breznakia blatticola]